MKNKIQICSILLTRRCNLHCTYCRISRFYDTPKEYPSLNYFRENEMTKHSVFVILDHLHRHNPDMFIILYGGEPFLRFDLPEIVGYCNSLELNYTVISNGSEEIAGSIDNLCASGDLKGLTMSVDPLGPEMDKIMLLSDSRTEKTVAGFNGLILAKEYVKDVVAEITVDHFTMPYLESTVKQLSDRGIGSDITFVDVAKNQYYDFSNLTDNEFLVRQTRETAEILQRLSTSDYDIHMKDTLLEEMFNILPSKLDCELEKGIHNLTIDADGSVRLCLRIRGVETPYLGLTDYIDRMGNINPSLLERQTNDKEQLCEGCNWTCQLMSKLLHKGEANKKDLLHTEKRK